MSSVLHPPRNLKEIAGEGVSILMILCLIFGVVGILGTAWMSWSRRDFFVVLGFLLSVLFAFVSGRPRLYCLWGLVLTIPLNLSKRIGPNFIGKPGGEDSFRIEPSDFFPCRA